MLNNQAVAMKVMNDVITPLTSWFDKKIPAGRKEVYAEVLGGYSSTVLQRAVRRLKQEWTQQSMPQPATIKDFCEKAESSVCHTGDLNFGEVANLSVCDCGQHTGIGSGTHYSRAQIYAWYKDFAPEHLTPNKAEYLKTYEEQHGRINKYLSGRIRP